MLERKICFVISSLKGKGGMERVATMIGNLLVDDMYEVTILTRDSNQNEERYFSLDHRVKVLSIQGSLLNFIKGVGRYVEVNRPTFVVAHNMGKMTLALSIINFAKLNIDFYSFEHVANISAPKYVRVLKRFLYRKVNKVLVLSTDDFKNYNDFHSNVVKINNPSPFSVVGNVNYAVESKRIISIGRLTYQKGFDLLLSAWAKIEANYPEWTYEIYGDGEDLQKLEELKQNLGIKNLHFKGFTRDLNQVYSSSSFFVLSSRFEGFGMVLIEAHSFGLPVVSFDCPFGPSDIIEHGVNGFLVENGNINSLASSISSLIEDRDKREKMSVGAQKSVKLYSSDNILNSWRDVLKK